MDHYPDSINIAQESHSRIIIHPKQVTEFIFKLINIFFQDVNKSSIFLILKALFLSLKKGFSFFIIIQIYSLLDVNLDNLIAFSLSIPHQPKKLKLGTLTPSPKKRALVANSSQYFVISDPLLLSLLQEIPFLNPASRSTGSSSSKESHTRGIFGCIPFSSIQPG
jgi:RNA recognition motif-containing protein